MDRKRRRSYYPGEHATRRTGVVMPPIERATDLPGFVYDPARKKYFRKSDAPLNNFTVPLSKLVETSERPRSVWIHRDLWKPFDIMEMVRISGRGDGLRRGLIAHRHNYLKHLEKSILTLSAPEEFRRPDFASYPMDGFLGGESPRFVFAYRQKDTLGGHLKAGCVNLSMAFSGDSNHGNSAPSAFWSKPPFKPNREGAQICSLAVLNSSQIFMSCRTGPGLHEGSDVFTDTNHDREALLNQRIQPHDLCAASGIDSTVATASTVSAQVRIYILSGARGQSFTLNLGSRVPEEVFSSSVEVVPAEPYVLVGTSTGRIFWSDHRVVGTQMLIGAEAWKSLGIEGHCRISSLKSCKNGKGLLTVVAGLPQSIGKMHLWDLRKSDKPLLHLEGACYPYSRYQHRINVSADESLVVCSDSEGTTRFWDLDSGFLMAEVPSKGPELHSAALNCIPPVALYSDNFGGRGDKVFVLATMGSLPSVGVHSI